MNISKKIYGTSIYIGSIPLSTVFGEFTAHTFQNLIHKGYVIALAKGDLSHPLLYTRIHSSCVTSETLRSLDCDCVLQLNGALRKIAEKEHGVLFYLIQEGRGCGYVSKSRSCMLVQYEQDEISTFDAYASLGLKPDYRDYSNIKEVAHMLGIEHSDFVLMTNNPDKIQGFQQVGLRLKDVDSIEVEPSPFNQSYLVSKQEMGHLLYKTKKKITKYQLPYERVKPFEPYSLQGCARFVYCASYYLPIKPVDDQMIYSQEEMAFLDKEKISYVRTAELSQGKALIRVDEKDLFKVQLKPYWFRVHMYYDLASGCDYVVLTYGDLSDKTPCVRVHSESLLNRFPLRVKSYKEKYMKSIEEIVRNESGAILLIYHDGLGAGLSNYVLNQTTQSEDTGIPIDSRDYDAVAQLLKYHLPEKKLRILFSTSSRIPLRQALAKHHLEVEEWVELNAKNQKKGHQIIAERIQDAPYYLMNISGQRLQLSTDKKYIVTGIGSSQAHAYYLLYLVQKYFPDISIRFVALTSFLNDMPTDSTLILISQGLSPGSVTPLEVWDYKNVILLTAVTDYNSNGDKTAILHKLRVNGSSILNFPIEDEYQTLIRTIGPLAGYYFIYKALLGAQITDKSERILFRTLRDSLHKMPDDGFIDQLKQDPRVLIVAGHPHLSYLQNLVYKLEEGPFLEAVRIVDVLEFAHGTFQNVEYQYHHGKQTCFIMLSGNSEKEQVAMERINQMLGGRYPIWEIRSQLNEDLQILEYEMLFNHLVMRLIEQRDVNQVNWYGKDTQDKLYSLNFPRH